MLWRHSIIVVRGYRGLLYMNVKQTYELSYKPVIHEITSKRPFDNPGILASKIKINPVSPNKALVAWY